MRGCRRRGPEPVRLSPAGPDAVDVLAAVHAAAFDAPWSADEIAAVLDGPGVFGLLAEAELPFGMILCRAVAGEAEVLTLAVSPSARRAGVGRTLVEAAAGLAAQSGAEMMFLEVAVDNTAALALYEAAGFVTAGRRRAYYDRGGSDRVDALVLRLDLNSASS